MAEHGGQLVGYVEASGGDFRPNRSTASVVIGVGTAICRGFFDGAGSVDEIIFPTKGFSGMTLRLFDLERE